MPPERVDPTVQRRPEALAHRLDPAAEFAMTNRAIILPYILLLIAVVVVVDVLFFRHHVWERLTVNIGIVLVFAAFYFRFLRRG